MINKHKRYVRFIVLTVLCVVLAGVSVVQGVLYFQLRRDCKELRTEKETYDTQSVEKQQKIESLEQQIDNLTAQIQVKDAQLEAFRSQKEKNEAQAEAEPQTAQGEVQGTLSPSQGESMFTDGNIQPGSIIDEKEAITNMNYYFAPHEIVRGDRIFQRIDGKSYRENNDIGLEQLRYLTLLHYNFDHKVQVGEMIVNAQLVDDVLNIFKELFQKEYEIQSVYLIDNYWEDGMDGNDADYASIEENNTSAFNYRTVGGSGNLSNHALGRAIDINPQQNPYVSGDGSYSHKNAAPYVDRGCGDPRVIVGSESDICYSTFSKYGFSWGGNWDSPKDYQHFERR